MGKTNHRYVPVKVNTKEETAAELAPKPHRWRIHTDGSCTDSGKGKESGVAGWGCYIEEIGADGNIVHVASLWGPVVTDHESRWFMGSPRGTNQTGEVNAVGQGLMWLNNVPVDDDDAAIVFDSMYAANMTQGKWKPKANKDAIKLNEELLATTSRWRTVHFVHVKGHSGNEGNDRADERVQWGKDGGPCSHFCKGGGEGPGRFGSVENNGEELGGGCGRRQSRRGGRR
jgi:ribonuclease HI